MDSEYALVAGFISIIHLELGEPNVPLSDNIQSQAMSAFYLKSKTLLCFPQKLCAMCDLY